MLSQEETRQFILEAWTAVWLGDLSALSEFYDEEAEISGYSPPKQTTWKGYDAILAHFKEIEPIVSSKSFNITNLDLVTDGKTAYATWNAEFEIKIPGNEGIMEGSGILKLVLKDKKVFEWTMYEDPTPFVNMAAKSAAGAQA